MFKILHVGDTMLHDLQVHIEQVLLLIIHCLFLKLKNSCSADSVAYEQLKLCYCLNRTTQARSKGVLPILTDIKKARSPWNKVVDYSIIE